MPTRIDMRRCSSFVMLRCALHERKKMEKEEIYQEILKRVNKDGVIACRQCFEISEECDASLKIIGEICDEHSIKVQLCQLGLFK